MRTRQGCRTCKRRKIGCDKEFPACRNCLRTGRRCLGYGIQLRWEDEYDGRRKDSHLKAPTDAVYLLPKHKENYGLQFLNVTFKDLKHSERSIAWSQLISQRDYTYPSPRCLSSWPDIAHDGSDLLEYYERRISSMICTIDSNNGFRLDLLPRALSHTCEASIALRNAIFAVSCFHRLGVQKALPFKTKALRYLSYSLAGEEALRHPGVVETQLAASLMLCVYSIFDETEGNWHLHLNGAKNILRRLDTSKSGGRTSSFLYTWFLYHEVLGGCSQHRSRLSDGSPSMSGFLSPTFDKTEIIGSLGFSLELLDAIHRINFLRDNLPSRTYTTEFDDLESQLLRLNQYANIDKASQIQGQAARILSTAEFYRIATLIYLLQVIPGSENATRRSSYVDLGFRVLISLPICTSPWPLFVLACEAQSDKHRIEILHSLDQMDQNRKIGNVFVIRNIIETLWNQQDLQADVDNNSQFKWWQMAALNSNTPWFI
ncbi:hypothetical protein TMatcc_003232 [Talaromyces marneffei ATCC 18224]|uniref:Acriflavine sensitivity control protein acr-2 n=1 Tax=Talaromyces marneffei PM1 TaxID=1077442 RepID=A0A093VR64_TALMA|nr:uncharacterized protein EYB26_001704 [Talaromyces marneffei]KAE8555933.1 hypothetical protein EYB25_000631 [Talaromyces marneffei]QGA14051.1 hypothetical protein EYB26_001704 [Talaromyces marneffei]